MSKKIIVLYILGMIFQATYLHADAKAGFENFADQIKNFGNSVLS